MKDLLTSNAVTAFVIFGGEVIFPILAIIFARKHYKAGDKYKFQTACISVFAALLGGWLMMGLVIILLPFAVLFFLMYLVIRRLSKPLPNA